MNIVRASALGALLLTATALFAQTTIHVPADQPTIQAAIDAANTGDTVLVSDGTYFEHIDFLGKAITVTSVNGAAATILDGQLTTFPVVTMQKAEPSTAVLSGFTVRNGAASFGSGVYLLGASPTIVNNTFESNSQGAGGYGAGIGGNGSSADIERNLFRNNSCDSQFLSGVISFINGSSPVIANNLIVGNSCRGINMTLPTGNTPVVINNSIVGNAVGIRVDARAATAQQLYENNIIAGNTIGLEVDFLVSGNEPTWKHNLLFNNTSNYSGIADQTGLYDNLAADPKFVNSPSDLHLLAGSSAIDAGDNAIPRLPNQDFDRNPRVVDGKDLCTATVDLGAYEFQAAPLASWGAASISFGSQPLKSSSSPQSVSLNNSGATCLQISGYPMSGDFSTLTSCGTTLPAGQSCNVSVTFTPTALGTRTGTLSLTSNSPVAPNLALSGIGVDYALAASPASVTISAGQTAIFGVSVTGQGGSFPGAVSLSCAGLPANSACSFSPASVGPGVVSANATMTITTTPQRGKKGTPSGTATITINGSSGTLLHSTTVALIVK